MFLTIFLITVPFPLNISLLYFDIDKAKRDSLSKDLIESAEFTLKYESLSGNSEDIEKLIQSRGIPIYGNWCGPKAAESQKIN